MLSRFAPLLLFAASMQCFADFNGAPVEAGGINELLTYRNIDSANLVLERPETSPTFSIRYGNHIDARHFYAGFNGLDITPLFNPVAGTEETVNLPVRPGTSYLLKLRVPERLQQDAPGEPRWDEDDFVVAAGLPEQSLNIGAGGSPLPNQSLFAIEPTPEEMARMQREQEASLAREKRYEAKRKADLLAWKHSQALDQLGHQQPLVFWRYYEAVITESGPCLPEADFERIVRIAISADALDKAFRDYVEHLVISDPACAVSRLAHAHFSGDLSKKYLFSPACYDPAVLHDALVSVAPVKETERWVDEYRAEYTYFFAKPVTDPAKFLWSLKVGIVHEGFAYVASTYVKGDEEFREQIDRLWSESNVPPIKLRYADIKILPLDALDFMTLHQFGTYYLVVSRYNREVGTRENHVVKGHVVHTALVKSCSGINTLLQIAPEMQTGWLPDGDWPPVWAIELRDDLSLPDVEIHPVKGEMASAFAEGTVSFENHPYKIWLADGVDPPDFTLTDANTQEAHDARETWPSCD